MGKKTKSSNSSLGRTLIKSRFTSNPYTNVNGDNFIHNCELNDGFEWMKSNNEKSVTEQNDLEEFIATAELAGKEFNAERLHVEIVTPESNTGILSVEQQCLISRIQDENKPFLRIPRRPPWSTDTTPQELDLQERSNFLEWRRSLAGVQEKEHIILTPFERNLDFWRQLWRVIEKSDVVVTIVDARNPLLFFSEDLNSYVKEVGENKEVVILINKADYLSESQRILWKSYFDSMNIKIAFWSAKAEMEQILLNKKNDEGEDDDDGDDDNDDDNENEENDEDEDWISVEGSSGEEEEFDSDEELSNEEEDLTNNEIPEIRENTHEHSLAFLNKKNLENTSCMNNKNIKNDLNKDLQANHTSITTDCNNLLNGEELLEFLCSIYKGDKGEKDVQTIGFVGYPNVGKSSTLNALLQMKKVPVSVTPGRTKHFQTFFIKDDLLLCDCPGLVMPSFVSTKAEMYLNGILPIDQLRDFLPPISLLCQLIPRDILEMTYGIMIPKPKEGEKADRKPNAHEFLSAYAYMRGYLTHKGVPDFQRASRIILKDFVNGKLLYCVPPPNVSEENFESTAMVSRILKLAEKAQKLPKGATNFPKESTRIDQEFFKNMESKMGSKGKYTSTVPSSNVTSCDSIQNKPWKKHGNRNKKEKLRRKHADHDIT